MSLLQLDQSTVANRKAALEFVCKRIPADKDSHDLRKAVADAMLTSANAGARSLVQFQEIGLAKLKGHAPEEEVVLESRCDEAYEVLVSQGSAISVAQVRPPVLLKSST